MSKKRKVLITGCAGFIGASLSKRFLKDNYKVIGIDNINDYYDQNLKSDRLKDIDNYRIYKKSCWKFYKTSINNEVAINEIFKEEKPNIVINLAAQAGVRFSVNNPEAYTKSNLNGFFNILENCRNNYVEHLLYASSSSVYGANREYPFTEDQKISKPLSFYAATKISNEMMAYSYSNIYKIPITGLRFFTVYGPWGRPDMAPMIFSNKIISGKPISVFNYGKMNRDFTFIDDIIEGTFLCSLKSPNLFKNSIETELNIPNQIFNIGYGKPVNLEYFIELLEDSLSIKAIKNYESMQIGDVASTYANTNKLEKWINYKPKVNIENGVKKFAEWFLSYYS